MKFSFEEYHIWHQWANSLICARQVSNRDQLLNLIYDSNNLIKNCIQYSKYFLLKANLVI